MNYLGEFIKLVGEKEKILITSHINSDVDSVCSAALLIELIKEINEEAKTLIYFPQGISSKAFRVADELKLKYCSERVSNGVNFDLIVFVDVGSKEVLGEASELLELNTDKVLIDHHLHDEAFLREFSLRIVDEEVSSTCELILQMCNAVNVNLPKKLLTASLSAILVETSFLKNVKCNTFKTIFEICSRGGEIRDAASLLRRERSFSEKVAILKGLKRMEIYRAGDWIFVLSKLSAYRSEASQIIFKAGADFIAVGGELNDESKINLRLSDRFVKKFKLNAGRDLVSLISKSFRASGGGHSTVANVTVEARLEDVFKYILEKLSEKSVKVLGERLIKLE